MMHIPVLVCTARGTLGLQCQDARRCEATLALKELRVSEHLMSSEITQLAQQYAFRISKRSSTFSQYETDVQCA